MDATMNKRIVDLDDGAKLVTYRQGSGCPILLVSGLGGTAAFWTPLIARQLKYWDMISFDQRGIGESTRGTVQISIALLADDCLRVLDAHGIERCVMIGHSTGGVITQQLAALYPKRLRAIVLSGSWISPHYYLQALFKHRLALLQTDPLGYQAFGIMMGYAPDWLCEHWSVFETAVENKVLTSAQIGIITERIEALLQFDGRELAPLLKMPTLVLGARDDAIVPSPLQQQLYAALPQAKIEIYESGGHFFPITRLEQSLASLTTFIGQYDG